jgi:hypothetical protein
VGAGRRTEQRGPSRPGRPIGEAIRLREAKRGGVGEGAPVHLGNGAAHDADIIVGQDIPPEAVVPRNKSGKHGGPHCPPGHRPFQHFRVRAPRGISFGADLDLAATQLRTGVDDERPDVLPDIQHNGLGVDPLDGCDGHDCLSPLYRALVRPALVVS